MTDGFFDRRRLLSWSAQGLGATALFQLLQRDGVLAAETHLPAKAKRAVQITLVGGLSHVDSFDPKPELRRRHGQTLRMDRRPDTFFDQIGQLRRNDFDFRPRGRSGLEISNLFPHIAGQADELTVIRSMVADSANHTPALFVQNSGFAQNGFPALGGWLSFGLGSEADDLPSYVVLPDDRGEANGGASNWTAGFLPAQHQGVSFASGPNPVGNLVPSRPISAAEETASRAFLHDANLAHAASREGDADLLARVRSYELAARMQLAVPQVANLAEEPASVRALYGIDQPATADAGRRCLLARRLLERDVRFVQIYSGGPIAGSPRLSWDAHENVRENHTAEARCEIDQPVAALLADLKRCGMLDDTLVLFTTEFGRTPFAASELLAPSAPVGITIATASRAGSRAPASRRESRTVPPTRSAGSRSRIPSTGTTSMRRCCISSASITNDSRSTTTAFVAD